MKRKQPMPLWLALATASPADDIRMNSGATPDDVTAYDIDVLDNSGEVWTLVDGLEAAGGMGKTLIVFFSDNGGVHGLPFQTEAADDSNKMSVGISPTSNAPLRGGKATIYEKGLVNPALSCGRASSGPTDTRTCAMIQSMDLHPALAAAAGARDSPHSGWPV